MFLAGSTQARALMKFSIGPNSSGADGLILPRMTVRSCRQASDERRHPSVEYAQNVLRSPELEHATEKPGLSLRGRVRVYPAGRRSGAGAAGSRSVGSRMVYPFEVERGVSMNPKIVAVRPNPDYTLTLTFTDGEVRVFDVKPYLNVGIFVKYRISVFSTPCGRS